MLQRNKKVQAQKPWCGITWLSYGSQVYNFTKKDSLKNVFRDRRVICQYLCLIFVEVICNYENVERKIVTSFEMSNMETETT